MRIAVRTAVGAAIAAVAAIHAFSSRRFLGRAGAGPAAFQAPALRRTPPRRDQCAARVGGVAFAQLRAGQAQQRRDGAVRGLAGLRAQAVGGEVQQGHGVLLAVARTVRERASFNAARG
jgi:hypothetical protein